MKRSRWTSLVCLLLSAALLVCPALADGLLDPPANGCVLDVAGVLKSGTVEHIVSQNEKLSGATGAAIVVVTVDFLNGKDIDDYALELFNSWGVGDAEKDNGVLILLAIGEEDYYVLQGTGLQKALPSSALGEYTWNYLENDFAGENYDDGVHKLFDALYAWFEDYYASEFDAATAPAVTQPATPGVVSRPASGPVRFQARVLSFMVLIGVVVLLLVLIAVIGSGGRRRRYSSGYYGRSSFWGRPRRYRPPRPPRPPRHPRPPRPPRGGGFGGFGGGFGGMLGGGGSRGGGAGRSSGPVHRSSGGGFRSSGGGRSLGGGSSRGGGAGRRH